MAMKKENGEDLATLFYEEMVGIYRRARDECGYRATRFLQMVNDQGGVGTAKSLLNSAGYSEGFTALWERGRADLTMESLVVQKRWAALFNPEEISVACQRLREIDYKC